MANEPGSESVGAREIQWDTETREDLADRDGHIRDDMMYLPTGLLSWMEETWGGVVTHLKTSTNVATGEVSVFKAYKGEEGATPVRRLGAQNNGEFSFWRPLHKLALKVPSRRQFNVTPYTEEVEGIGTLFVFPMSKRVSVPRGKRAGKAEDEAALDAAEELLIESAPSAEE